MAFIFSLHAFGLPGKVMIMVVPLIPVMGRERAAKGVIAIEEDKMSCVMPGVSLVNKGFTAYKKNTRQKKILMFSIYSFTSGVTSLGEKPVPPVTRTRFK